MKPAKKKRSRVATSGRGRPTKLTPDTQKTIVSYLRKGNTVEAAATAAGVHRVTLHEWLARGRTELSGPHVEFLAAVEQAQAMAHVNAVERLQKGAEKDWKAALAFLERRYPDEWGKRNFVQVELQNVKDALQKVRNRVDPATYDAFLAALEGDDDELTAITGNDEPDALGSRH